MAKVETRLNSIQILRALAALMVVFHHSHLASRYFDGYVEMTGFRSWVGGSGVDLFFLISGYIFSRMTQSHIFNLKSFIKNRFWRIYPNYWVFTMLVVTAHLVHPPWNLGSNVYSFSTIIKSFLILPQMSLPLLILGWTLEQEMVFYFIFATMNFFKILRYLISVLLGLGIAGIFKQIILPQIFQGFHFNDYKILSLFQIEFAAGVIIFTFGATFSKWGWRLPLISGCAISVFTIAFTEWSGGLPIREVIRTVGLSLGYGAVMIGALNLEPLISFRKTIPRILVLIGEASYSLYLSHWFILSIFGKFALLSGLSRHSSLQNPYRFLAMVAAVFFALIYYSLCEKKLIRLQDYFSRRKPTHS